MSGGELSGVELNMGMDGHYWNIGYKVPGPTGTENKRSFSFRDSDLTQFRSKKKVQVMKSSNIEQPQKV